MFLVYTCFLFYIWPIHTANLQAINAVGRIDLFLKLEIINKTIGIVAILISLNFGPLIMVYSLIVTDLLATAINGFPNRTLLNYSYNVQLKDMVPSFLIAFIMAVIIYTIAFLHLSNFLTILLQVSLGAVIYLVLSIIIKQTAFIYLVGFNKKN